MPLVVLEEGLLTSRPSINSLRIGTVPVFFFTGGGTYFFFTLVSLGGGTYSSYIPGSLGGTFVVLGSLVSVVFWMISVCLME